MTHPVLRRRPKTGLSRWGGPVALGFMACFIITLLVLCVSLESVDDEDLVSKSNDWRRAHLKQVDAVVNGIRTKLPGRRNKRGRPRVAFEEDKPPTDLGRIQASVEALRKPSPATQPDMSYDVFNCPEYPVEGYPQAWSAQSLLEDWNPDDTDIPSTIYQGICLFDWNVQEDRVKIQNYREAEKPFVVRNHSDILRVAERWNTPGYLQDLLESTTQRNDHADTNHLMFSRVYKGLRLPAGWKPPTDEVQMNYADWLKKAQAMETAPDQASREHWYFRINAQCNENPTGYKQLCDEVSYFSPLDPSLFIVEPDQYRGLNCRFGMKGVIAETHYDNSRNWITVLGGQRRYILAHPEQCTNLELYGMGHPSARHGSQDWSHPVLTDAFRAARLNEVVLDAGDALYLPTAWFHFIVSLNINYQCNSRSGSTMENKHHIDECGFQM